MVTHLYRVSMALRSHSLSVAEAAEATAVQVAMMMAPSYAVLPLDVDLSIKNVLTNF